MKNLIISIVLVCIATIATAQKKYDRNWYITNDSATVKIIYDSLVKLCNYKYEFYILKGMTIDIGYKYEHAGNAHSIPQYRHCPPACLYLLL